METRSVAQRLDDLEHDNNLLRSMLGEVSADNSRLRYEFEQVQERCDKLIKTVNDFVARFAVVN